MSVLSFILFFYVVALWHCGALYTLSLSPSPSPLLPHLEPVCSDVSCECNGKATKLGKTKIELGGGLSTFLTALHLN